jgi:PQQ-like domain
MDVRRPRRVILAAAAAVALAGGGVMVVLTSGDDGECDPTGDIEPTVRIDIGGGRHAPAVADGQRLYARSAETSEYAAFDVGSGDAVWTSDVERTAGDDLAVADGTLFIRRTDESELVALDGVSGDERWRVGLAEVPEFDSSLAVAAGRVLVAGPSTVAFDANSGDPLWSIDTPSSALAAVDDMAVLVADATGDRGTQVVGVDAESGDERWSVEYPQPLANVFGRTLAAGDRVIAVPLGGGAGPGQVAVLDVDDGHEVTVIEFDDGPGSVAAANGVIAAAGPLGWNIPNAGDVFAVTEDGDRAWSENYDGAVMVMSASCWLLVRADQVAALVDPATGRTRQRINSDHLVGEHTLGLGDEIFSAGTGFGVRVESQNGNGSEFAVTVVVVEMTDQ